MRSTVRSGFCQSAIHQKRYQHVLPMQRAVRAHMRNRLVPRAEIPVARGGKDQVPGPGRAADVGDLHYGVG